MSDQAKRRIDDAGERIEGARKDWKSRAMGTDDLAAMTDEEIVTEAKKDNVWPKPDWEAAVAAGMDPLAAAHVKLIRDRMAQEPKPRRGFSAVETRKAFVNMTADLRDRFMSCRTVDDVKAVYRAVESSFPRRIQAGDPSGLKFFSVYKARTCPFAVDWKDGRKAAQMVSEGFPATVPAWRKGVIARTGSDGSVFLVAGHRIIEEGFASEEEAFRWLEQGRAGQQGGKKVKEGPKEPSRPHLDRVERSGLEDYRGGRDVSPEEFIETFGLRGVQFGLWLPDGERQLVLNHGYDAMMDLAKVLGWEPRQMSLEGTLAVAFGARGKGGRAAAHYEPGQRVVNMSRMSGAGSFAHEFAHALDHWTGTGGSAAAGIPSASGWHGWPRSWADLLSHRGRTAAAAWEDVMRALISSPMGREDRMKAIQTQATKIREGLARNAEGIARQESLEPARRNTTYLRKAKKWEAAQLAILEKLEKGAAEAMTENRTEHGKRPSTFLVQAQRLSGSGDYWKRPAELFARAFESWVFDEVAAADGKSEYLVHSVEDGRYSSAEFKGDPYPSGEERERINRAMRAMATAMAPLVEHVPAAEMAP